MLTGCSNCSKSGSRARSLGQGKSTENRIVSVQKGSNVVKMKKEDGVYFVPIEINGANMEFIFDTGASTISMSATEVLFLIKQGKLNEEDVLGTQSFIDATGTVSEGTLINLKTVKIGNKTLYNVTASIVNNLEAPLLLGQSALAEFGKVTIDYQKNEITFE